MQDLRTAAMRQAIEALEQLEPYVEQLVDYSSTASEWPLNLAPRRVAQAITALRAALAAEQEPVAEFVHSGLGNFPELRWRPGYMARVGDKFYTATPTAKPLTADEVFANNEIMAINAGIGLRIETLMDLARAIECAHGIGVQK